jgi:AcrR family transcriptional regulator
MTPIAGPAKSGSAAEESLGPRERIVRTAYELFSRDGVQRTGIDQIIAEAGVAKASLYRNFRSKDDLVLAVLERREQVWTHEWLEREVETRASGGRARLLVVFDVFDEWFSRSDYEACLFVNTLMETRLSSPSISAESVTRLGTVRTLLIKWAEEAGVRHPGEVASKWQLLMLGSIVAATAGDTTAAHHARDLGALLLDREPSLS